MSVSSIGSSSSSASAAALQQQLKADQKTLTDDQTKKASQETLQADQAKVTADQQAITGAQDKTKSGKSGGAAERMHSHDKGAAGTASPSATPDANDASASDTGTGGVDVTV